MIWEQIVKEKIGEYLFCSLILTSNVKAFSKMP